MPSIYDQRDWLLDEIERDSAGEVSPRRPGDVFMTTAAESGQQLGAALAALFGVPTEVDFQSAYVVASFFAKGSGYNQLDAGSQFVMGFAQGLQSGKPPKQIGSGASDDE